MSKRRNEAFITSYMELDRLCCDKFGVATGGVTEYINRLNSARFAPGRDDVLPRLVRYRGLRNRLAHEVGAIRRVDEINKADIGWVRNFRKEIKHRRDPISVYLRKARRYARRRKLRRVFFTVLVIAFIVAAVVLCFMLIK